MHPLLLQIGFLKFHTYGLMMVIGFLTALRLMQSQATRDGIDGEKIVDVSFWSLVWGLIGSRVLYIITAWDQYAANPIKVFYFWEGGLVFYGGMIGGAGAMWYLSKKYKLPVLQTIDYAAPALAIAHFFGRIGCFFAGCCYGKPAENLPWAVTFHSELSAAPTGIPLHPTQLYDALNALTIFLILMWVARRKKFTGQVISTYLILYSIGRAIVESFRGDKIRGFLIEPYLSTSTFISIFVFAVGVYMWIHFSKKNRIQQNTGKNKR